MAEHIHSADYQAEGAQAHEVNGAPSRPAAASPNRWDGRNLGYIPSGPLRLSRAIKLHTDVAAQVDPITFEVIRNALWIVNEEQADTIRKVAASSVTVYSYDLNTAIQTEAGEPILFAPYIQYFAGVSDLVIRWTLENRSNNPGIFDGDIFFQNDPLIGVSHQMDVQTFAPVFVDGRSFAGCLTQFTSVTSVAPRPAVSAWKRATYTANPLRYRRSNWLNGAICAATSTR